jgi:hypothetical protein
MVEMRLRAVCFIVAIGSFLLAMPAHAGLDLEEGMWRLELNNDFGVHQGSRDRAGDYSLSGSVDYEVPATSRTTLSLRLMPLFLYTQNDDGDERRRLLRRFDNQDNGDTVWGAGLGIVGRIYQVKDEYRGWYGEVGATALGHNNEFAGNTSNLNFITTLGVGYQFKSDWHVQLHYQHISNASLGSRNAGANSLGVGIGYRF